MDGLPDQESETRGQRSSPLPSFSESSIRQKLLYLVAVTFSLVSLYFGIVPKPGIVQQAIHLCFVFVLTFSLLPPSFSWRSVRDLTSAALNLLFLAIGPVSLLYLILNYETVVGQAGQLSTATLLAGAGTITSVIYAAKKTLGWTMPVLAVALLAYAVFGPELPGPLRHGGYALDQVISFLFISANGIFGSPLKASATLVIFFLLFSAFFERAGGGNLVIDLANSLVGWVRGGPAKVAVVASGLFGSISGSAVANVAGTGSITIPMMKRIGYKARFAGAVEAAASTGGQYMPPIMGAAAFIMAEILGVPYGNIVIAAAVPALLYFLVILLAVDLETRRLGVARVKRSELPSIRETLVRYGHMLIPLGALIYMLVFLRYSPARSAMVTVVLIVVTSLLRRQTRLGPGRIMESLRNGAVGILQVAAACACAGIVVGIFSLTGLGLKLSFLLIDLSGGSILVLLMLTAVASIILGMGMPTVGAYLVLALLIAPILIEAGVNPIAAHLFIFYFGNLSNVTPPVALAAYTAAGLSGGSPLRTGVTASRLALAAFIIPFLFVYSNGLILQGDLGDIVYAVMPAVLGVVSLAIAMSGYLRGRLVIPERVALVAGAVTLVHVWLISDVVGVFLCLGAVASNVWRGRKRGWLGRRLAR